MEMKRTFFILISLVAFATTATAQATRVIAHRGFWNCEGSAQNSIASLTRADQAGCYGSEFDVQFTLDSVLVVNHDDDLQGRVIAQTPYDELRKLPLANGEPMPTLQDYLETARPLSVRLILEIKPLATKAVEDEAAQKAVTLVRQVGLEHRVDYISFSLNVCQLLAQLTPASSIAYLSGDIEPADLKAMGINGIDYRYTVLQQNPEWVQAAHDIGMTVNTWTVNSPNEISQMASLGVDFITTDNPIEALEILHDP